MSWRLANQIVHPGFLCLEELNHPGHLKKTRRLLVWIGLCLWPLSLASRSSCFGFRLPAPFPATAASCTIGSRNYKKVLKLLQEWREIKSTHRGLRVKKKKKDVSISDLKFTFLRNFHLLTKFVGNKRICLNSITELVRLTAYQHWDVGGLGHHRHHGRANTWLYVAIGEQGMSTKKDFWYLQKSNRKKQRVKIANHPTI